MHWYTLVLIVTFFVSMLALVHSYLLYPFLLQWWASNKSIDTLCYTQTDDLPIVSVLMAVYNEETIIEKKLQSLFQLEYPADKIHLFIGSDASSDSTNSIVASFQKSRANFNFFPFEKRRGKPEVINELSQLALQSIPSSSHHVFLMTDASVLLNPDTLFHLVKHFKSENIAIVDANMVHTGILDEGISKSEDTYLSREVMIKHWESTLWQTMIGPFGGCYVIRSNQFHKIPPNYLVDDFYITMKVLEQGYGVINDLSAICYEPVSHEIQVEYRRKRRISAGNFQNMMAFQHLWWPPFKPLNFAFFSHKIIRWMGPILIITTLVSTLLLSLSGSVFFLFVTLLLIIGVMVIPLVDYLLSRIKIDIIYFRNIRYFVLMNIALLAGFFNFLKGVKTNVWQPTKRDLSE